MQRLSMTRSTVRSLATRIESLQFACFALALVAAGCGSADPKGEPVAWSQAGLTVGNVSGCDESGPLDGLNHQLIAEQNCIRPNALVSFAGAPGISIGSGIYPFLEPAAADGLKAAAQQTTLDVTSAFRTLAEQYLLYGWYQSGQCGITLAAVPGNSNHETGTAVDLGNYGAALSAMEGHGWTHSYPSSDPVHYDYTAGGTVDLRAESVLAFQKLWNVNNPKDMIAEDGSYGPITEARVAAAPATGFPIGTTCGGPADAGVVDSGKPHDGGAAHDGGGATHDGGAGDSGPSDDAGGPMGPGAADDASLDQDGGEGGSGDNLGSSGSSGGCAVTGARPSDTAAAGVMVALVAAAFRRGRRRSSSTNPERAR